MIPTPLPEIQWWLSVVAAENGKYDVWMRYAKDLWSQPLMEIRQPGFNNRTEAVLWGHSPEACQIMDNQQNEYHYTNGPAETQKVPSLDAGPVGTIELHQDSDSSAAGEGV